MPPPRSTKPPGQNGKPERTWWSANGTPTRGQKWRETYEYGEDDRISKDVLYNERDKVVLVRKYEYNPDGSKKKQFNYAPNGKLETVKVFEYATSY